MFASLSSLTCAAESTVSEKLELEVTIHHPFHFAVAEELLQRLTGLGELIRDVARGGAQHPDVRY